MSNNKKQILSEAFAISYENVPNLQEKLVNDEPIFLEGIIQRANVKNHNNRIYTKAVLEREVQAYKQQFVKENRALGELDHPERDIVEFKTSSHRITDIWWKGDDLWGKIEILSGTHFPCANILRGCLKNNIPIGFSSRGYGSELRISNDTYEVGEDYMLICWDAVPNPSTKGAFGSLTEAFSLKTENELLGKEINNLILEILK